MNVCEEDGRVGGLGLHYKTRERANDNLEHTDDAKLAFLNVRIQRLQQLLKRLINDLQVVPMVGDVFFSNDTATQVCTLQIRCIHGDASE